MAIRYAVRSAAISGFLVEAGDAANAILREAGIDPSQLDLADTPIEIAQLQRLLAVAAERLDRPDFGLRVAQHQGLEMLGLLGNVLSGASTLQELCSIGQRYMSLHSTAEHWQLQTFAGQVHVIRAEHGDPNPLAQQYHEMAIAVFHRVARQLSGQHQRPLRVAFAHSQVGPLKHYLQYFGCDVLFDQEHDCLVYPESAFYAPLPQKDQYQSKEAEDYLASASAQLEDNLELQIRNMITELIGLQDISIERVAALLNLHPRSLQRRLKEQNLEFRDLVQDVRIKLACWHLQASRCDITRLSDMLGYSDLSSFSRAFRRRIGVSPAQWRQQIRQSPAASQH